MASEISSSEASKQQQQQQQEQESGKRPVPHKILKADVRLLGRFLLDDGDEFNVDSVRSLVARATEQRLHLQTQLRLTSAGLQLGKDGVLSSMPAEVYDYDRVAGLLALTDDVKMLALCLQSATQQQRRVTLLQFKDAKALNVVVDVIDRHRRAEPLGNGSNAENWLLQQEPQQVRQVGQHHVYDDDDGIDPRVVIGSSSEYAMVRKEEVQLQQQRTTKVEVVAEVNGGGVSDRRAIESEILNYDDVSQRQHRSEASVQLRRQQQQQQQQRNVSASLPPAGRIVTSFSSGGGSQQQSPPPSQQYRTSTVIYRDINDTQQRVTYLPQPQPQPQQFVQLQEQQQQPMQVMRLVPVASGSGRRQQRQSRYYTLQPLSPRESGLFTVAK